MVQKCQYIIGVTIEDCSYFMFMGQLGWVGEHYRILTRPNAVGCSNPITNGWTFYFTKKIHIYNSWLLIFPIVKFRVERRMESNFHIRYIDDIHPNNAKSKKQHQYWKHFIALKTGPQKNSITQSKRQTITRAYYIMSCSMGTCLEGWGVTERYYLKPLKKDHWWGQKGNTKHWSKGNAKHQSGNQ
jgi:hypothetical protein